jgi:hypothetical protein
MMTAQASTTTKVTVIVTNKMGKPVTAASVVPPAVYGARYATLRRPGTAEPEQTWTKPNSDGLGSWRSRSTR